MTGPFLIGVDVGTGSARAGVFAADGALLGSAKQDIETWSEPGGIVEQSGDRIWAAVCEALRGAVAQAGVDPAGIAGVGFDATCSLVAVRDDGSPVAVGASGDPARNVIVWMDHRATPEAREINEGGHAVLAFVGGRISPEMQTPKLSWLKRHLPEAFAAADHFMDLSDYLTWRATGSAARSTCTVTCKWTYLAHEGRWDAGYFRAIGLGELVNEGFRRIGTEIVDPGTALGRGLTVEAAAALGLAPGTAVAASLIDAHAGGVGTLGAAVPGGIGDPTRRLAYIFGTSACSMASTPGPVPVEGVWGPYYSAMIPGLWLNEGGQSAAGAAIDHLVRMHPASAEAEGLAAAAGLGLAQWLVRQAAGRDVASLAGGVHVVPEFLGNRSPLADPEARAVIAGLGMERGVDSLIALYVAGLCGIGYGLRQLLERFRDRGIGIDLIVASGGAAQDGFVRQALADATGVPVAVSAAPEPVLLGAAMLAAVASGAHGSLAAAMGAMSGAATVLLPDGRTAAVHNVRHAAFLALQRTAAEIRAAGS